MLSQSQEASLVGQKSSEVNMYELERSALNDHDTSSKLGTAQQSGDVFVTQSNSMQRNADAFLVPRPKEVVLGRIATLKPIQVWRGTVIRKEGNQFWATILDQTNPSNPEEEGEFSLDEVSPEDQPLVAPGSTFYWTIGTEKSPAGQVRNVAMLQFQRLPRWTEHAIRAARNSVSEVLDLFSLNG